MNTVAETDGLLARHIAALPPASSPLEAAQGRLLREDLYADRPLPPFDRVAVDGYAFRLADYFAGYHTLSVAGLQRAGAPASAAAGPASCMEVLTGAVLPAGYDAVVMIEDTARDGDQVRFRGDDAFEPWENVHRAGSDRAAGERLVPAGTRLAAPHIGIAASVGKANLQVAPRLRVAVISTGDELVEVAATPAPHQIRRSNAYAVAALLDAAGVAEATLFHAQDDEAEVRRVHAEALAGFDAVVTTGGVSAGRFDLVPGTLAAAGVAVHVHGVAQKPGKPFLFGTTAEGKPVFGLPGNPVAVLVCTARYVVPGLRRRAGWPDAGAETLVLDGDPKRPKGKTLFAPVRLRNDGGARAATPQRHNGSGDYAGLAASDGFVEIAADAPARAPVPYFSWRP